MHKIKIVGNILLQYSVFLGEKKHQNSKIIENKLAHINSTSSLLAVFN
jgi:hypothetical protein